MEDREPSWTKIQPKTKIKTTKLWNSLVTMTPFQLRRTKGEGKSMKALSAQALKVAKYFAFSKRS